MKNRSSAQLFAATLVGVVATSHVAASPVVLDEAGTRNLQIKTVVAEEQDFETTVFAIGRIEEIPESRSVVSSRIPGRVVELDAYEGDRVKQGQTIARVESRQLGDPPPSVELLAPQSGLVVASHVRIGQPVEPAAELMDISDRSTVWAVARIPEQEAAQVRIGSKARIHVPALGDTRMPATLTRFGVEADRETGTIDGIFVLQNADGRLQPGMRTEFSIVMAERKNVLAVPKEAIQGDPANRVVFVADFDLPNVFHEAPVVLGEQNDRYAEVLSGLFPGDKVVTRGSYGLSYAGSGSGISLKEALDAAHGHEHNEDGSEMTPEQRAAARKRASGTGEPSPQTTTNLPLAIYAGVVSVLLIVTSQQLWTRRRQTGEPSDAQ